MKIKNHLIFVTSIFYMSLITKVVQAKQDSSVSIAQEQVAQDTQTDKSATTEPQSSAATPKSAYKAEKLKHPNAEWLDKQICYFNAAHKMGALKALLKSANLVLAGQLYKKPVCAQIKDFVDAFEDFSHIVRERSKELLPLIEESLYTEKLEKYGVVLKDGSVLKKYAVSKQDTFVFFNDQIKILQFIWSSSYLSKYCK